MKTNQSRKSKMPRAFTLVEMLVVISVVALLAAMLFPAFATIKKKMTIKKVKAELAQVASAIDAYKLRKGYYPPDHVLAVGVDPIVNSLYFELSGVKNTALPNAPFIFQTLDGAATITALACQTSFGRGGIMNCSKTGEDGGQPAWEFLKQLKPNQYGELVLGGDIRILTCSVNWPVDSVEVVAGRPLINPWRYVSTGPTNNNDSFDLWVDIVIGNKTNRISNWSETPEIVP